MKKLLLSLITCINCISLNAETVFSIDENKDILTWENKENETILKIKLTSKWNDEGEEWLGCDLQLILPPHSQEGEISVLFLDSDGFGIDGRKVYSFGNFTKGYTGPLVERYRIKRKDFMKIHTFQVFVSRNKN